MNPYKDSSFSPYGKLVLLGSTETSPTALHIQRIVLQQFQVKQKLSIIETPAGFQPNSTGVAEEVKESLSHSLHEFIDRIDIVPARKRIGKLSTNNPDIFHSVEDADYILLGAGSPSYALHTLENSKLLDLVITRWQNGATISCSSAATLPLGRFCLPVYEIYKVGTDLFWEKGWDILSRVGLSLTVIPHWDNTDGGEKLDTSRCYMGKKRFDTLCKLLDSQETILGIDDNTAIIFDFAKGIFSVEGVGKVTLLKNKKTIFFKHKRTYILESLRTGIVQETTYEEAYPTKKSVVKHAVQEAMLAKELQELLKKRKKARKQNDYSLADTIREIFEEKGFIIEDNEDRQIVYKA